jgi:hypothetical protein
MTDRLEERLVALRGDLPRGDWLDVQNRVRRRRARRAAVIAVAAVLAAIALVPLGVAGRIVDLLTVEKTEEQLPQPATTIPPYVFGDVVYRAGRETKLAQTLLAPFLGPYEHLAIASPDGGSVVYHAWHGPLRGPGPSLLRRHDFATGRDDVLVRGAQSFAWRRDGAVAYMRALRPRYVENARFPTVDVGHVEVRPSPDGSAQRWTTQPTGYVVRAWAGDTLLVEVRPSLLMSDRQPAAGIYALGGPGRLRRLPITDLIAVSPDGRRAVGQWRQGDGPSRTMRLVDIATGRSLAQVQTIDSVAVGPGDWRGESVVGVLSLGNRSSLVLLRATADGLFVRDTLGLDRRAGLTTFHGAHFHLPLFVAGDEVVVGVTSVAKNERDSKVRFLACDLGDRRCRSGRSLEPLTRWAAVLTNPSPPVD